MELATRDRPVKLGGPVVSWEHRSSRKFVAFESSNFFCDPCFLGWLFRVFCRQPKIERGSVNSPGTTYLEPRKSASIDHAIDCRRVHAQYFGNFADGENILDFRPLHPSPVHS